MSYHRRSPSSSPVRKRQRLSSPTYDDQLGDLSQEHLDALDEIEARLTQAPSSQDSDPTAKVSGGPRADNASGPTYDLESPFFTNVPHLGKGNLALGLLPIQSREEEIQQEGLEPKQRLYVDFLDPPQLDALPLFRSAKYVLDVVNVAPELSQISNKENEGVLLPSKEALAKARDKLKMWEKDWDDPPMTEESSGIYALQQPDQGKLLEHIFAPSLDKGQTGNDNTAVFASSRTLLSTPVGIASQTRPPSSQTRPFRMPTFKHQGSPLNIPPKPSDPAQHIKSPSRSNYSTSISTVFTPLRPQQRFLGNSMAPPAFSPARAPPSTPRSIGISKKARSAFKTPFKPGALHSDASSSVRHGLRENLLNRNLQCTASPTPASFKKPKERPSPIKPPAQAQCRGLSTLSPRKKTLQSCGVRPQEYEADDLEDLSLNIAELRQVNPVTALHYSFYTPDAAPPAVDAAPTVLLNSAAAYEELAKKGFHLATKAWVDNHWSLILWKLAGMAAFDPHSEQDPERKRWCWAEVVRQLSHRYEKELEGGNRPALRRIVARDSPANCPLVLCISGISWTEGENGRFPELEVTDGWYRVKAQVDAPLARAIHKGMIREGRKIGVVGARLSSEKKEPMEILEAYESVKLILSGNSSHLAPWYATLGFQRERYISTLHSLTPDGGLVACLDVVVLKIHPIGYLEFIEKDGQTTREGPRNEAEEARIADRWLQRRDVEASKLKSEHDRRVSRLMDYMGRLETKAQSCQPLTDDDDCPESIESYYDDLEDHTTALQVIARLSPKEALWLARVIRQNLEAEHERIHAEIEKDLADICPPRNVRSFRVVVVQDARTERRPSNRTAQLTVWDAENRSMSEDAAMSSLQIGVRYLVSNLIPTQAKAWMKDEPGAEIFMSTRRDSQWLKMKQ